MEELKILKAEIIALKEGKDLLDENGNIKHKNEALTLSPHPSHSYAFCSDSRLKMGLKELVRGVDMLYHEATFTNDLEQRAIATYHSTAAQAAAFAKEAAAKKLILGHFSSRYNELDPILQEAKSIFENSELAIEGTKFKLDEK